MPGLAGQSSYPPTLPRMQGREGRRTRKSSLVKPAGGDAKRGGSNSAQYAQPVAPENGHAYVVVGEAPGQTTMSKPFVLAHLSDPHLGPLPQPGVRELASKRLVGYINWRRSRRRVHRRDVLDAITRDLHGTQPDHVAVTGDLVNIALPAEFAHARRWLETLGPPAHVSVVPGNHDAYVAGAGVHRNL